MEAREQGTIVERETDLAFPVATGESPHAPAVGTEPEPGTLRISHTLGALSFALDITEGQPEGHAARSAVIGMRLACEIGFPDEDASALYYALLLKDLGCSSNAAKVCYLFGSDDQVVKRDLKTRDWSRFIESAKYALANAARGRGAFAKLGQLFRLAGAGPAVARELVQIRCERGADIAASFGFPDATAAAIHDLDEHWDGSGHPAGLAGDEIGLMARILGIAQTMEVFLTDGGPDHACDIAVERSGTWFDPDLSRAAASIRNDRGFWSGLMATDIQTELARWEPEDRILIATESLIDQFGRGFGHVVDAKSPWTFEHSDRVTELAIKVGAEMGLSGRDLVLLRRAALLHDIGKLGISNRILHKEGPLDDDEYRALKAHPRYSREILQRVVSFEAVAELAGSHHERLDGSGYDRGLAAEELSPAARALAVADVYDALSTSRPYRDAFPVEKCLGIVSSEAGVQLCPAAAEALQTVILREQPDAIDWVAPAL